MITDRNADVRISAWLDEGPSELPDQTRRAITTATRTIPQHRRGFGSPWRNSLLNGYARAALAAAAIVVIALGGLYLLGPGQRSIGGPPTSPTPSPSPSMTPASADTGTIILRDDGCTWEGNPGRMQSPANSPDDPLKQLTLRVRNETDHYGSFFLHRMRYPHTYDDGEAYVADLRQRLVTGEEWPENTVSYPVSDFDIEAGQTSTWRATLQWIGPNMPDPGGDGRVPGAFGTFAVVCSANTSATGDVLSIYSVGPLELTAFESS